MNHSSRLELKIARNFSRSNSGVRSSRASCKTRLLNSSQLRSRSRKGTAGVACRVVIWGPDRDQAGDETPSAPTSGAARQVVLALGAQDNVAANGGSERP